MMDIPLSAYVKVRLTSAALEYYRAYLEQQARQYPACAEVIMDQLMRKDADGYYPFQLWTLIKIFGPLIDVAIDSPFEGNVMTYVPETLC
jgi:hypothetical protein